MRRGTPSSQAGPPGVVHVLSELACKGKGPLAPGFRDAATTMDGRGPCLPQPAAFLEERAFGSYV